MIATHWQLHISLQTPSPPLICLQECKEHTELFKQYNLTHMSKLSKWQVWIASFITWETTDENILYTEITFLPRCVRQRKHPAEYISWLSRKGSKLNNQGKYSWNFYVLYYILFPIPVCPCESRSCRILTKITLQKL